VQHSFNGSVTKTRYAGRDVFSLFKPCIGDTECNETISVLVVRQHLACSVMVRSMRIDDVIPVWQGASVQHERSTRRNAQRSKTSALIATTVWQHVVVFSSFRSLSVASVEPLKPDNRLPSYSLACWYRFHYPRNCRRNHSSRNGPHVRSGQGHWQPRGQSHPCDWRYTSLCATTCIPI
jgi:hypothetical protein